MYILTEITAMNTESTDGHLRLVDFQPLLISKQGILKGSNFLGDGAQTFTASVPDDGRHEAVSGAHHDIYVYLVVASVERMYPSTSRSRRVPVKCGDKTGNQNGYSTYTHAQTRY